MNDVPPPIPPVGPAGAPVVLVSPPPPPGPPRRSLFGRLMSFLGFLLFFASVILNVSLIAVLAARGVSVPGLQTETLQQGQADQTVALYRLEGVIHAEATELFTRFYRQVRDDANVRAIVLRVNSPGGTVSDSEQIHRMIADLKSRGKTVVVSMGGLAASGGYYISAGADDIFAEPVTVTGSIGVITGVLNLEKTLQKIGMKMIVLKSRHAEGWKDLMSSFRQPEDREKQYVVQLLDQMQTRFEAVVREGRGDKLRTRQETYSVRVGKGARAREETRKEIAPFNGKVYLAEAAKDYGLVDEIGYLDDALDAAAKRAGLSEPNIVLYRRHLNFLETLSGGGAKGLTIRLDAQSLQEAQTPQFLLLWKPEW